MSAGNDPRLSPGFLSFIEKLDVQHRPVIGPYILVALLVQKKNSHNKTLTIVGNLIIAVLNISYKSLNTHPHELI